jgi:hypothetical protein
LINGMWRAKTQYSWPASILTPVSTIQTLNISGQYFSFDPDAGEFYTSLLLRDRHLSGQRLQQSRVAAMDSLPARLPQPILEKGTNEG